MRAFRVAGALIVASALAAAPARAGYLLPSGFALEKVKGGLNTPTAVAFAPDGRIFYLEKGAGPIGKVRVIVNGEVVRKPVLEITNIAQGFEVGMLGLALDPNFASNHYLYLYYTQDGDSSGVVVQPTWKSIQDNLFGSACLGCHGVGPAAGLQLFASNSYRNLVNAPSSQAPAMMRVKPFDPDGSYLVRKLESAAGIVGNRMPPGGPAVDAATLQAVRDWIAAGAPAPFPNPAPVIPDRTVEDAGEAAAADAAEKALPLGVGARNRVVRYREAGGIALDPLVILDYIPAAGFHNGGVLEFAPDGTLLIQTGENGGDGMLAQDGNSLAGKILRINPDGTIPANNPFVSNPAVRDEIFSLGHRNGFGLAPDSLRPAPLRVYVSENGPDTDDEVNVSVAGKNYGWPQYRGMQACAQYQCPIATWTPAVGLTGIAHYTGNKYPSAYFGDLFIGRYNLENGNAVVERLELDAAGAAVASKTVFFDGPLGPNGYVLDVLQGPDGRLYFSTGDALFRVGTDADSDGCADGIDPKPSAFSADADGDGFGADCDCAPTKKNVNPAMPETEGNGLDDDCDESTPPPGACPGPTTLDPGARPEFPGWANLALYLAPAAFALGRLRRGARSR